MFAEKPVFPPSKLHLPSIGHGIRRKPSLSPTSLYRSKGNNTPFNTDNISELKAKYTDYMTWLKTSNRHNHGPIETQELLKNSLCQMGIDSVKAEQLVSTCHWYVYQFQKDLKIDPEVKDQLNTIERKKQNQHKTKLKKMPTRNYNVDDSSSTITSLSKDDLSSSHPSPSTRNNHLVLPAIRVSDLSTSSRFRHVDFNSEQMQTPNSNASSTHWRAALMKTKAVSKLQPQSKKSSANSSPLDIHLSSNNHRSLAATRHTRSILRKQNSSSSSTASTDISSRKTYSRILTPSSTILDDIPLGTRSRRLFGGSECFAQIMNELELNDENI
ncbi:unnamed protein product [Adineta steineri]|uniref:Uncharacterized protein n=1 Tax=Adineta steineri TaxID=433720 RepID=A0A814DDE3_9BILA|nr:unnamed protein product [Adineta steineri]CAF3658306.1 unnamed protein product [Adineta steineri]